MSINANTLWQLVDIGISYQRYIHEREYDRADARWEYAERECDEISLAIQEMQISDSDRYKLEFFEWAITTHKALVLDMLKAYKRSLEE